MNHIKSQEVAITADSVALNGTLSIPDNAKGIIVFAHGSGSSRFSPRNQQVAGVLNEASFATLLFDLLSAEEYEYDSVTAEYRFNIPLLSERLVAAIDWTMSRAELQSLPIGLFGASTGSAAALVAAAERPDHVHAVVSRGGRPDLAEAYLTQVRAPTLLIIGGQDQQVQLLNQQAAERMAAPNQLVVVPDATHLFEEPGKLEEVARLAVDWFEKHCPARRSPSSAPDRE
ncbi:MAG: alpha/beta family hydrolase [Gammaproteobacteria bacterium]|nr:alpha/beta family hydrolase [Gammaproteobacteria bacterium]